MRTYTGDMVQNRAEIVDAIYYAFDGWMYILLFYKNKNIHIHICSFYLVLKELGIERDFFNGRKMLGCIFHLLLIRKTPPHLLL
jgi:hypothetical protein